MHAKKDLSFQKSQTHASTAQEAISERLMNSDWLKTSFSEYLSKQESKLPFTVTPDMIDPKRFEAVGSSVSVFTNWLNAFSQEVVEAARRCGAVRFQGFSAIEPFEFDAVRQALPFRPMPYVGGAAVRNLVYGEHIFTTNESPPTEPVPFHHELSQTINPPDYIAFYCQQPSRSGGETPLVDSRRVYQFMASNYPEFTQTLEQHGVKYVRILPPEDDASSAIGRSWPSTWQIYDRSEAEEKMRAQGMQWEWLESGNLKTTTQAIAATRNDPRTGEPVFYNSMIAAYKGWIDSRNDPKKAVRLGNDQVLDCDILESIYQYMLSIQVALPWQSGDILFIDNWVTMHARNPFEGSRKILASIGYRENTVE